MIRCPQCRQPATQVGKFWVCPEHGPLSVPSLPEAERHPLLVLAADLPFPLALAIGEYVREDNPFVKLHRLTDAAELLTRFAAMVLLSDILRQRGVFPEAIRTALAEKIARPTFGAWKDLLALACEALPRQRGRVQGFVAALPAYLKERLLPYLGAGDGDVTQHLIALRNLLAHAGRIGDVQAQELLTHHQARFEALLVQLSLLTDYTLVACTADGRALSLRGVPPPGGAFPPLEPTTLPLPPQPERILLMHGADALDLFPLHAFSDVLQWREEQMERIADAAPQVYLRLNDKGYLEFTTLSDRAAFSQQRGVALERFRELFRLEEWRRLTDAERQRRALMFEDVLADLGEVFVGRDEQVTQVKECLKAQEQGVFWIGGGPGVGKSALMAKLVQDYRGAQHYLVIPYFFRTGHAGCSTEQFLRAALVHLSTALDESIELSSNPEERRKQFVEAVHAASERSRRKVLFLIDGLDEMHRIDSSFVSLPFVTRAPRVVWLCAGQRQPALEEALRQGGAQWVFPDGLPTLNEQGIRAMLTAHLERLKYHLFARDEAAAGTYRNRFIEVLVRKSEGLPLYIRMVIEDLRAGKWTLADEDKLPDGLSAYFEQLLERLRVSDMGTVLTPLFCLLAWAKEPVTEAALKVLLSEHHLSQTAGWEELFRRALSHGHLMLRSAPTPDGEAGWTFYHDTFRQHLLTTGTVGTNREWAQATWLRWCAEWRTMTEESLRRYALRFGVGHLADAAIQCLKDAENWPGNAARNEEQATSYVDSIVSLLSDLRFRDARTGIGLGIAAQAEDARVGIVAALVLGNGTAAAALLRILADARTSGSSFQDLRKTVEAAVPDLQGVIRALAPFHPPEQAALALWFAIRLDERGLRDVAVNLIDWTFTNRRESLAAWPAHPFLEQIVRALDERIRLELARELTMCLAQARGFEHPAWSLSLYDRSADKTDLQKAIDALTSGRLPDSVPVGDLWGGVLRRLRKHPEMQPQVMQWCLSHDYAAMACSAAAEWLSNGARLEDLPIAELLDALGEADDANRGMGLALLATGVLDSAGTAQEARERLAVLAATGPVSSQAASAWVESAFWTGDVDAERAAEYVHFLLAEIGPCVDDEEIRDNAALSLACEVAAHARWAALKESGTGGEPASSVGMSLDLLTRIEERLGPGRTLCRAILDLTVEWGKQAPGLDRRLREQYSRGRRRGLPPNRLALDILAEHLDLAEGALSVFLIDSDSCDWIDGWLRDHVRVPTDAESLTFGLGSDRNLTADGVAVKLGLQNVLKASLAAFKVLPAPILLHVAEHAVGLCEELLGWQHRFALDDLDDLDYARTVAVIDLLEPAGVSVCPSGFRGFRRGVNCGRLRRWPPARWVGEPARRIIELLAGMGESEGQQVQAERHMQRLAEILEEAIGREPRLASVIEALLQHALTMESGRWRDDAVVALASGLLKGDSPRQQERAKAVLVENKALDELLEEVWRSGDVTLVQPILGLLRGARDRRRSLPALVGAVIAHGHDAAAEEVVSEALLFEAGDGDKTSSEGQAQPQTEPEKEPPWERARSLWTQYAETVSACGQLTQDITAEMEENPFVVREIVNAVLGPAAGNDNLVLEFLVLEPERQEAFRAELRAPEIKENWAELLAALPAGCKRSMAEPLCRAALLTARRDLADAAAEIAGSADDSRSAECVAWAMLGLGDQPAGQHWAKLCHNRGGGISDVLGAAGDLHFAAQAFAASALAAEDPWEKLDKLLDRSSFGETGFKFPYLGISEPDALVTFLHFLSDKAPVDDEDLECFSPDALLPAWFVRLPDDRAFRIGALGWRMIERSLASHLDALAAAWAELVLRWAFARPPLLAAPAPDGDSRDRWLERENAFDYLRVVGFAAGLRSQSWRDEHISAAFFLAGHAAQELGRRSPFRCVLAGLDKAGRWGARSDYEEIVERVARKEAYGARLAYAEYCAEAGREAEAHDAFAELLRDEEPGFLHIRAADAFRATSDKIRYLRGALGAKNQESKYVGQLVEAALELELDGNQILDELQARHSGTSREGAVTLARAHAALKRRKSPPANMTMVFDLLAKARLLIKREELPSFAFWNAGELEELLTDKWVDTILSALKVDALTPQEAAVVNERIIERASPQDLINTTVQTRLVDLACRAMLAGSQTAVGETATKLLDVWSVEVETAARLFLADTTLASDAPRRLLIKVIQSSDNQDKAAREAIRALAKTARMESMIEECYRMIASPEQALLARDDVWDARDDPPMERVEALATHAIDGDDFRRRISDLATDVIQQMPEVAVERREKLTRILLRYAHPKVLLDAVKVDAGRKM
jgi:hypothetical protein